MKTGMRRQIDPLGRIVIPIEMRKSLKWNECDIIYVSVKGDKVILEKSEVACVFCGSTAIEKTINDRHVCANCIDGLKRID